ncbi:Centrosomal protein [Merluccius polli]|uniref:Centrosomal protein n=1 Tax=Merluccius polli TaxID=89951 RepID=A0AA47N078_MERPO|nr:Centrosomal protein [Merluccius polli]
MELIQTLHLSDLTRLLEELRQAKEAQSPELRHLRSLEAKVHSMELRHTEGEPAEAADRPGEAGGGGGAAGGGGALERLAQGRGREVEAFRLELDAIWTSCGSCTDKCGVPHAGPPLLNAPFT